MPHADIKCTTDLEIDLRALMANIEEIILQLDPSSGVCKGRIIQIRYVPLHMTRQYLYLKLQKHQLHQMVIIEYA